MTALAVRAVTAFLSLFGINLSGFAAGAIAMAIGVAAIGGGLTYGAVHFYNAGYESADGEWKAKELQAQIDKLEDDRDAARGAAASASIRVAAIQEQSKKDKDADAKYIDELKSRPPVAGKSTCDLTDADRRGMRDGQDGGANAGPRSSGATRWFKPSR